MPVDDIVIEAIDVRALTDEQIAEANDFVNAVRAESNPEDPPRPLDVAIATYRNLPDFLDLRIFTVRTPEGELIADGECFSSTTDDNRHLMQANILVLPNHRRHGIATALLRKVTEL